MKWLLRHVFLMVLPVFLYETLYLDLDVDKVFLTLCMQVDLFFCYKILIECKPKFIYKKIVIILFSKSSYFMQNTLNAIRKAYKYFVSLY